MVHSAQRWIIGFLISAIAAVLVFDLGIEDWHMMAGRLHSTTFVPLLLSAAGLALAVGVIGYLSRAHDSNSFEIFLGENLRQFATQIPFIDADEICREVRQREKEIPPIASALRVEGNSVLVNLILRNNDKTAFESAIVTIGANLPFSPETPGATVAAPNEVYYDNQTIQSFKQTGVENCYLLRFSLTQPLTKICIWGLVRSGKIRPYLGIGSLSYRKVQWEATA